MTGKQSISTILLLAAAVVIWCLVGYRVWRWFSPKDAPVVAAVAPVAAPASPAEDSLLLQYRDPFFKEEEAVAAVSPAPVPEPATEPVMPALSYKGLIRDGDGCVKALVAFDGKVDAYRVGEKIGEVKVLAISPEALTVRWRRKEYTIAAK